MKHSLSVLLTLSSCVLFSQSVTADESKPEKLDVVKGEHVNFNFRAEDWKVLKDKKEFASFFDDVYQTMAELTCNEPPMILRGYKDLGAWGTAGTDGVNIDWNFVPGLLKDFNVGKIEFGLVHEMGHVFDARDFARWYITPSCAGETLANIKLSYSAERLLREDNRYRIEFGPGGPQTGYVFNNAFYLDKGKAFVEGSLPWDKMSVDDLHSFHLQLVRKFGWDVYKKWFRAYILIDAQADSRAPASTDDPVRMHMVCALLSRFSGENLIPYFQQWRVPVTEADIASVTKRYKLDRVCDDVDNGFAKEFAQGKIQLDPLSLSIRTKPGSSGNTAVSIFNIFGELKGVSVRYTVDGTPVGGNARSFSGTSFEVKSGTEVKASLLVPGNSEPALTSSLKVALN